MSSIGNDNIPYATRYEVQVLGGRDILVDTNNARENGLLWAENYGVQTPGLTARNGNGALYGETTLSAEVSVSPHLLEIQAMRSAIAESPREGDPELLAYLAADEQLVTTGHVNRRLLTDAYPDLEDYIFTALTTDPELQEMVQDIVPASKLPETASASLPLLEKLKCEEATRLLDLLIGRTMQQQMDASADSHSPLVAA